MVPTASVEVELTVQQRMTHSTRPPMSSQVSLNSGSLNRCSSPLSTPLSPNSPTNTANVTSASNSPCPAAQRPLQHHHSAPARDRITAPQPVDVRVLHYNSYFIFFLIQLVTWENAGIRKIIIFIQISISRNVKAVICLLWLSF